jgi:hypothetical protein
MPVADAGLKHFRKDEIVISSDQARTILLFFFGFQGQVPPSNQLTDDDVAFAQALFLEAIDESYAMGYVKAIFDAFYGKPPASFDSVKDMIKDFVKAAAKNWFTHARGEDFAHPKIYESIRVTIAVNFKSVWAIRVQTGELTY